MRAWEPPPLSAKTVALTGATGGLGSAFAWALASAGAELILAGRDPSRLGALADGLRTAGHSARTLVCDITDASACSRAFEGLDAIDVLVNNAGANLPQPFLEVTPETFDSVFALNVRGALFCAQAAARRMVAAGSGVIINVTSQMGHVGGPDRTVYCASKHALEGLTKAMALELAPRGVRVCSLAPTYVHTPMTAPFFADQRFRAEVEARIPLGRIAAPADVAGALVFLASPAASFVCGSSLIVDGGYTAQ
jgi:NAD(P)-dependent dehydrogenase (short-subunit alcohol dehydrogenase family)